MDYSREEKNSQQPSGASKAGITKKKSYIQDYEFYSTTNEEINPELLSKSKEMCTTVSSAKIAKKTPQKQFLEIDYCVFNKEALDQNQQALRCSYLSDVTAAKSHKSQQNLMHTSTSNDTNKSKPF